jgi:hypothetical protein
MAVPSRISCGGTSATDSTDKNRPRSKCDDQSAEDGDLIRLFDEQARLIRLTLPEHVIAGDLESLGHQPVPERHPELDVLGQSIDENADRCVIWTGQLVVNSPRVAGKPGHVILLLRSVVGPHSTQILAAG